MPRNSARALLPVFCAVCLSALSQQNTAVRIGVALPAPGTQIVPDAEVRNQLVKVLNEHKTDKKHNSSVEAVPLDVPPSGRAVAEATAKDCQFVLYTLVKPLDTSFTYEVAADGSFQNVALANARVEYLVRRVKDGASYAAGTAKSEPLLSDREALRQAVERVARHLLTDLETRGSSVSSTLAESDTLAKLAPTLTADAYTGANFCAWLPSNIPHTDALRSVCEYAMTLPQKMPNFICHQETSRFQGRNKVPTDLITANVRYENGDESYSDLRVNGKPAPESSAGNVGLWSSGQFEGNLRDIFHSGNHAAFEFSGANRAGDHAAWVFSYSIPQQYEPLWQLRAADQILAPPYTGELWVDQRTGEVLRFRSAAKNLPSSFPMQNAEVTIDYDNVAFGDGTAFVLPVASSVATRFRGFEPTRNVVQFRGCRRFHATARMIVDVAEGPGAKTPDAASAADLRKSELEEDETIYAILGEQAIREDAEQLAVEQERDLKWATIGVMSRLAALERQRQRQVETELASAETSSATRVDTPALTYKVSVNLVPVSVVARDGKGRAVGGLVKDDFRLFDEKRPQVITRFMVEKAPTAAGASGVVAPAGAMAEETSSAAVESSVAYVFDDLHASREDLTNAAQAGAKHLAELRGQDRAAVYTTSGEINVDFTSDRVKLLAALNGLKPQTHPGWDCPQMTYYMADLIVNHADATAGDIAVGEAKQCAGYAPPGKQDTTTQMAQRLAISRALEVALAGRVDSERTLGMLAEVIYRTAAMQGRKSIVLVSPGFLTVAPDTRDRAMGLIERALQANVLVNVLAVSGLTTLVEASPLDSQETVARNQVVADLAYGTGGTFFHNNNDLDQGFRQTADMPEYIYVLGFSPQKLDGKFHKLKVKLTNGEKLTVQARAGYYALKATATQ